LLFIVPFPSLKLGTEFWGLRIRKALTCSSMVKSTDFNKASTGWRCGSSGRAPALLILSLQQN
jgi:hypothetical protein